MTQRIQIIMHEEVPPSIVQLVRKVYNSLIRVDQVIFTSRCTQLEGRMAAFVPDTGSVVIDLDACVKDLRWMNKGASFIANAWFNLLYCIYHEANHARQVEDGLDAVHPEYMLEMDADTYALDDMADWALENQMPALENMGYIGNKLQQVLNRVYHKRPEVVDAELEVCGKAVAIARAAANSCPNYKDIDESVASLETAIDEGRLGVLINGERYLNAYEFIDFDGERSDD